MQQKEQNLKSKEEILAKLMDVPLYRINDDAGEYLVKSIALKAMEAYANQFKSQSGCVWVRVNREDDKTLPKSSGVYFVKIEKWGAGARLLYSKELGWMYDEKTRILIDDYPTFWLDEQPMQDEAVEFVEWTHVEGWKFTFTKGWYKVIDDEPTDFITTQQLYTIFRNKQESKPLK